MTDLLIKAVLIGLASWRFANLLVDENGPWDIFEKLRQFVGLKPGPIRGFFPQLFSCIYCMSVWTTIASFLLYLLSPTVVMIVAAASIALICNAFIQREN